MYHTEIESDSRSFPENVLRGPGQVYSYLRDRTRAIRVGYLRLYQVIFVRI